MWLDERELLYVIKNGETSTIEFKISPPRPGELAERICGMANGQGGFIILGIEDSSLEIVGIQDVRMAIDVVLRAARQIQPALLLNPSEPEVYTIAEKQIIVVCIPPNSGPLYQSGGVCWIRRGTHTIHLSVSEMLEIANDRGLVSWELQPVHNATMADIDLERVRSYLSQRSSRSRRNGRFEDLEKALLNMKCVVVTNNSDIIPTNAGLLFFGYNPQCYLFQCELVCVLYHDELGVGGYVDRKIITGTLQELIDQAEAFLDKYIAIGAKIEGWKRVDQPEYPIEALREAVVNAVVHRDYSRSGESIRIFYYSDRIEIHSPGLLLPGITVDLMARGEVISKLRNPILANLLRDLPGYIERIGSGIRLMLYEMRKTGLADPQFKELSEFVVIFRKKSVYEALNLDNEQSKTGEQQTFNIVHGVMTNQRQRIEIIMRYVQEHGSITNRECRNVTGVSENTALRDLEVLVIQKALVRIGKRRGSQYKLP